MRSGKLIESITMKIRIMTIRTTTQRAEPRLVATDERLLTIDVMLSLLRKSQASSQVRVVLMLFCSRNSRMAVTMALNGPA